MVEMNYRQSPTAAVPGTTVMWGKYIGGTAVVALCLATPFAIGILMMLNVPMNPVYLIAAAVCAVIGLVVALSAQNDEAERAGGGPPEDEF